MSDKAQAYVDSLDIHYDAAFVPQSQSHNAGEKHKSLNWRITLGPKGGEADRYITTDYMQGIAHVPGYSKWGHGRRTLHVAEREGQAAERGRYWVSTNTYGLGRPIPKPALVDVLSCLVMDADTLAHGCFEDWADCYGYDQDSRKALAVYQQCIDIALKLRQFINLNEAREAFEDY